MPPSSRGRRALGAAGEAAVATWYERGGYAVLARNWRCGREGEVDLVLSRNGEVVFCEVKTRSGSGFGSPVEAVGWRKQRQLRRLASAWLAEQPRPVRSIRFDVASVFWPPGGELEIEVIEAAF